MGVPVVRSLSLSNGRPAGCPLGFGLAAGKDAPRTGGSGRRVALGGRMSVLAADVAGWASAVTFLGRYVRAPVEPGVTADDPGSSATGTRPDVLRNAATHPSLARLLVLGTHRADLHGRPTSSGRSLSARAHSMDAPGWTVAKALRPGRFHVAMAVFAPHEEISRHTTKITGGSGLRTNHPTFDPRPHRSALGAASPGEPEAGRPAKLTPNLALLAAKKGDHARSCSAALEYDHPLRSRAQAPNQARRTVQRHRAIVIMTCRAQDLQCGAGLRE